MKKIKDFDMEDWCKKNYCRIYYQSDPIGRSGIVLYLTKIVVDDEELKEIEHEQFFDYNLNDSNCIETITSDGAYLHSLERRINDYVRKFYGYEVERLKDQIHTWEIRNSTMNLEPYITSYGDVINGGNIQCDVIDGDVTNCESVVCNTIEGDVINCKVIYRKE